MNKSANTEKPPVAIYHALHRSGGTLIGRCLGSLPGVTLLSEVNPKAPVAFKILQPAYQAYFWQKLFDNQTSETVGRLPFEEQIEVIYEKSTARGDRLLLRDWPYVDFIAHPWDCDPKGSLSLAECLENRFELFRIAVVRHPLDQWLSWLNYEGAADARTFGFAPFLSAVRRFTEATRSLPLFRYEQFIDSAEETLKAMCVELRLPYDPVFLSRWRHYRQITGDELEPFYAAPTIKRKNKRKIPAKWLVEAESNDDYQFVLETWGYEHPESEKT